MPGLNSVSCGDTYDSTDPPASIEGVWTSRGGWFTVNNNPAVLQLQYGTLGVDYWQDEQRVEAGSSAVLPEGARGVRFRNGNPGQAAVVSGFIAQGPEPVLSLLAVGASVSLSPPLNIGTGDAEQLFAPTAGTLGDWRLGQQVSPDTSLNPAFKVTRTVSVADGAVSGSAPEQMSSIYGIGYGTTNCGKQPIGVLGVSIQASSSVHSNNDALGVMGFGETVSGATGNPLGGFFAGKRNSGATGLLGGCEIQAQNYTSADTYNPAGFSNSAALYIHPSTDAAAFNVGVGLEFVRTTGAPQFDVGIGFAESANGTPCVSAAIRDDSNANNGIIINGTKSGFGIDLSGGSFAQALRLPNNSQIVALNAAGTANIGLIFLNASNLVTLPNGLNISDGKNIQVGGVNGTQIAVGTSEKLGFWGKTPVVQQQLSTGVAHTVDDVISFLQTVGLCHQ